MNNSYLEKRIEEVIKSAQNLGLNIICKKSDTLGTMSLLFRKMTSKKETPNSCDIIEITAERNENWFESIKERMILAREADNKDK